MGHHFGFFRRGYGPGLPEDDPLRLFIRKHKKTILLALALVMIVALVLSVLAVIFLFKVFIPAFSGAAASEPAQSGFAAVKSWLTQLAGTNPLQWLGLLLQAG